MKLMIYVGLTLGSLLGGWLGAALDRGNWFGGWSIFLGACGAFLGIWAGYKVSKNYL